MLLPLAITVVTVPFYLEIVGIERYGLLTLCWVLLGYLGFLDLGLGPAISQRIAANREHASTRAELVWTALWISLAMGSAAAVILRFAAEAYLQSLPRLPDQFEAEVAGAMPLLGVMAPIVMISSVLSGSLQGREKFLEINLVACLGSSLMSLLPLLVAYFLAATLPALIIGALAARLCSLVLLFILSNHAVPLGRLRGISRRLVIPLFRFGAWVTLSSVAAPLLMTVDRLIIGAVFGAAAVAAYSIPFGVLSRLVILPVSLSSALFPRFAWADDEERRRLIGNSIPAIAAVMTPVIAALMILLHPLFSLWLGSHLAEQAAPIAFALGLGIWVNCIAQIPLAVLQGSGRPDLVSKLMLAEILPYWVVLAMALWLFGLPGAAAAWSVRMVFDCIVLCRLAGLGVAAFKFLLLPAGLVMASSAAALVLEGPVSFIVLIGLFALALSWSAFHVPEALHSRLGRWGEWLPAPYGTVREFR